MTLTRQYPGTLTDALASPYVNPGDRLLFQTGTYSGDFMCTLTGSSLKPIDLLPNVGSSPVLNGSFYSHGQWLILRKMEIKDADFLTRSTLETGSLPSDIPYRDGIRLEVPAMNVRIENCVVHDCRQGVLQDAGSTGHEINGLLAYYNGWSAPDRGHGHAVYVANSGLDVKLFKNCALHSNFGYGFHIYGQNLDPAASILQNIHVDGCTMFDNGVLVNLPNGNLIGGSGQGTTVRNSWMKNCHTYRDAVNIGFLTAGSIDFILQDNVFCGDFTMLYYGALPTITGNKFYGSVSIKDGNTGLMVDAAAIFPANEYHVSGIPDLVFVDPNDYQADRALVTIYNNAASNSIVVDLTSVAGLVAGDTVKVHNVQDYFSDIQTLVLDAGKHIDIDMRLVNHTVAVPQGWPAPASVFPVFGCFILEKA